MIWHKGLQPRVYPSVGPKLSLNQPEEEKSHFEENKTRNQSTTSANICVRQVSRCGMLFAANQLASEPFEMPHENDMRTTKYPRCYLAGSVHFSLRTSGKASSLYQ